MKFEITPERHQDAVHISRLMDVSFGPGRFTRAAYRLREGRACVADLSFVARDRPDGRLAGAIRFWPVLIGDRAALLLGPLAVDPRFQGLGAGMALIAHGCDEAAKLGHELVILVGDLAYYSRAGFVQAGGIVFPGPVDQGRILVRALEARAADGLSGEVHAARPAAARFCGYESVMMEEVKIG